MRALLASLLLLTTVAQAGSERIPLLEGTVYTYAASFPKGDEEHIVVLTSLTESEATFGVAFQAVGERKDHPAAFSAIRRVRRQDLLSSHRINNIFQTGDAELFPGSTFMHLSAASLQTLKSGAPLPFVLGTIKDYQGLGSGDSLFALVSAGRKYFRGEVQRVGSATVPLTVLVNGVPTVLHSIEINGRLSVGGDSVSGHGWWLDDAQNALLLKGEHSQLVRIDFPQPVPQQTLAQSLSTGDCRATLPGIYFDTASATLLPQSGTALDQVARLLKANPAWTLTVEGHTDNVGGAAYNLDLSRRRAAAVQAALLGRDGVAAQQISASGFGLTRPVRDNATLEGRAANRRVELVRACK